MKTDQYTVARQRLRDATAALDAILDAPPHLLTTDELKAVVGKRATAVKHAACQLCETFVVFTTRST